LVLVGGDYLASGDDYHRVPGPMGFPKAVSGIVLQALIVNTLVFGLPVREVQRIPAYALIACICTLMAFFAVCIQKIRGITGLSAGVVAIYVIVAFLAFRWLKLIFPLYGAVAIGLLALSAGLLLRLRLAPFPSQSGEEQ